MVCYSEEGLAVWRIEETEEELSAMAPFCDVSQDRNASHRMQTLAVAVIADRIFNDRIFHLPSGRPYLASSPAAVSVSNTGRYAAMSWGPSRAGVDMELKDRNASRVIGRVSSYDELAMAKKLYPANGELLLWCLKEAAYKMVLDQPEGIALDRQKLVSAGEAPGTAVMGTSEGLFRMKFFELDDLLVVRGL